LDFRCTLILEVLGIARFVLLQKIYKKWGSGFHANRIKEVFTFGLNYKTNWGIFFAITKGEN
jgi:hypothetical protein